MSSEPILPLSRPLRKSSVNDPLSLGDLGTLDQLIGLLPRCDEVTVSIHTLVAPLLRQHGIINGVEETVRRLHKEIHQ